MLEKTVVKNIMRALDSNYPGFYFKTHGGPYQAVGLPDIIGLHKGKFIGIEAKVPGKENTLTDKQKQVIRKIKLAGGIAFMATSAEQVLETLEGEFINGRTENKKTSRGL